MIVFKDFLTEDELLTESYPFEVIYDGAIYRVVGKMTTETLKIDDSMFGGNKSAEGCDEDEGADDAATSSGIDVVVHHRLQDFSMPKKEFKATIKDYIKLVGKRTMEECPDEMDSFKKGCDAFIKEVFGSYDDWDIYVGESLGGGESCMPIMCKWEDLDIKGATENRPVFYYFKHGLKREKY